MECFDTRDQRPILENDRACQNIQKMEKLMLRINAENRIAEANFKTFRGGHAPDPLATPNSHGQIFCWIRPC